MRACLSSVDVMARTWFSMKGSRSSIINTVSTGSSNGVVSPRGSGQVVPIFRKAIWPSRPSAWTDCRA